MRGDIGWPRPALSARLVALNIGTRVIDSIPAATTTSCVPDMTACSANWIACCDDPHCRSIDTAGTLSGNAESRKALRPIWKRIGEAWCREVGGREVEIRVGVV